MASFFEKVDKAKQELAKGENMFGTKKAAPNLHILQNFGLHGDWRCTLSYSGKVAVVADYFFVEKSKVLLALSHAKQFTETRSLALNYDFLL